MQSKIKNHTVFYCCSWWKLALWTWQYPLAINLTFVNILTGSAFRGNLREKGR